MVWFCCHFLRFITTDTSTLPAHLPRSWKLQWTFPWTCFWSTRACSHTSASPGIQHRSRTQGDGETPALPQSALGRGPGRQRGQGSPVRAPWRPLASWEPSRSSGRSPRWWGYRASWRWRPCDLRGRKWGSTPQTGPCDPLGCCRRWWPQRGPGATWSLRTSPAESASRGWTLGGQPRRKAKIHVITNLFSASLVNWATKDVMDTWSDPEVTVTTRTPSELSRWIHQITVINQKPKRRISKY